MRRAVLDRPLFQCRPFGVGEAQCLRREYSGGDEGSLHKATPLAVPCVDRSREGRSAQELFLPSDPRGVNMKSSHGLPKPSRRVALGALVAAMLAGCASQAVAPSEPDALVSDARMTLNNFVRDPGQTWIQENLGRARAVLIAPQIVRAGFIFGGSGGRALLVARDGTTWAGPAFYNLATASVGFQAGVEVSEAIIVVMTDKGLNSLLSNSFKIGGDARVAAGPVGAGAKSTVTVSYTHL